jgi:hypothetical protein
MIDNNIPLELTPEVEQIATSYFFDSRTKSIVLELNHKYSKKRIVSQVVKDNWTKTLERFESEMKRNDISLEDIKKLSGVASNNYQIILPVFEEPKTNKKQFIIQKYRLENVLAEAVIVDNKPYFAIANTGGISLEKSIEDFSPPPATSYLNRAYVFKSREDFDTTVEKAKHETIDTLYLEVKKQWRKYSTDDDFVISLCAADTLFTYFQDGLGMTHYLFFVGAPDSGKSNRLMVLNFLAYRNMMSTDMTPSNIYRFLGSVQEGQGTICEDEADDLDDSPEKMKIYKSGYTTGYKVPRNEDSPGGGMTQDAYCTYGFKAFAAEKLPDSVKAKGLKQRLVEIKCPSGIPQWDISEVANPAFADEFVKQLDELKGLRNTLLAYRLVHFNDKIPDIKLNIANREKQLFKPLLRVFQATKTQPDLLKVVSHFVRERRGRNTDSLHSTLYRLIEYLIETHRTYQFETKIIWDTFKEWTSASDVPYHPLSCETAAFGVLSQKIITEILEDDFSAERPLVRSNKRELIFNKEIFEGLKTKYDLDLTITVSQLKCADREDPADVQGRIEDNSEGPERENPDSDKSKYEKIDNKKGSPYSKDPPHPLHPHKESIEDPSVEEEQPDLDAVRRELEERG